MSVSAALRRGWENTASTTTGGGSRKRWSRALWRPAVRFGDLYRGGLTKLPFTDRSPKRVVLKSIPTHGSKGSPVYLAHSYPTKVPPEAIIPLIEHFTRVGDVVCDPFA